jgi:nicotinamidase-related amidase
VQHRDPEGMPEGSEAWQLYPRLLTSPTDLRVGKTANDAFHRTGLDEALCARGVKRLVVCGAQSEFCVDSTVRGALAHGYEVTLVADGHTTLDNGVLTAGQIVAHENATLRNIDSYGPRVALQSAADVAAGA